MRLQVSSQKIDINTADKEQLMTLSGIGEAKAESIIRYRAEHGNFAQIEDITNVDGIGESLFQKIKEYIYLDLQYGGILRVDNVLILINALEFRLKKSNFRISDIKNL